MVSGWPKRRAARGRAGPKPYGRDAGRRPPPGATRQAIAGHEQDNRSIRAAVSAKDRAAIAPHRIEGDRGARVGNGLGGLGHGGLPPGRRPVAVALSIRDVTDLAPGRLGPGLMARSARETAAPAAKLDPATLPIGETATRRPACEAAGPGLGCGYR